jgi:DNA-binding LacI/PurR family transcriptional regulator
MAHTGRTSRVTIADVAALAGVSRGAVSQVFNGTGKISEATAERIREAATTLNWSPSPAAVGLRLSRTYTVALVLSDSSNAVEISGSSAALLTGLESALTPRGYGLLLYVFDKKTGGDEETAYRSLADTRRVDGVVLTNSRTEDTRFELMRRLQLPAVLVGTPHDDDPIPHLDSSPPGAGIAESVRHLVDLGHRRLAYVGGPTDRVQPVERRREFEAALAAAGLSSVATIATSYSSAETAAHTTALLSSSQPPTGILYGSDGMAIAGMKAAKAAGFTVPDDLSVIGYDGLAVGQWVDPELTTVSRDTTERGRMAALRLLQLLGEDITEHIALTPPELLVRGSTGPAPRH